MDPAGISLVDNVQLYGKTKDAFGWPDEQEEFGSNSGTTNGPSAVNASNECAGIIPEGSIDDGTDHTAVERLVSGSLDILDG